ncbi:hypothetical protein [Trichocoleus desertorum]|uniref:hypothetical protein n=1 Tax=Trichocoleus desertorum TaxID=1481672 RepID=UPI003D65896A
MGIADIGRSTHPSPESSSQRLLKSTTVANLPIFQPTHPRKAHRNSGTRSSLKRASVSFNPPIPGKLIATLLVKSDRNPIFNFQPTHPRKADRNAI